MVVGMRRGRIWVAVGAALLAALVVVLIRPGQSEPPAAPASADDCRGQLLSLRETIDKHYREHGSYPRELFNPYETIGVPDEYKCPVCKWNYSYDPKRWPGRGVICTYPPHSRL